MQTTTVLPNPAFGDTVGLTSTVKTMRAMDGTLYSHVQTRTGRKRLKWEFTISRNKALELREFIDKYFGSMMQATDHNGDVWVGFLKNNPFEFAGRGRAASWPGGEVMNISIEFEEK